MDNRTTSTFDFDEWQRLAQSDPVAFEARRAGAIRQLIEESPPDRRARLERLQWRIDMRRRKYRHPLASSQWLYGLMWDSCAGDGGLLAAVEQLAASGGRAIQRDVPAAQILPFRTVSAPD